MAVKNKLAEDSAKSVTTGREIVITRLIDAPRELVFQAFIDPQHVVHWWGPRGFTNTIEAMDVRPGGAWRFVMHGPDGVDYPNRIVYQEIVSPERLVYTHGSDQEDDPQRFHVTITFAQQDGKTRITMYSLFPSVEACEAVKKFGAVEGGHQTLERLEERVLSEMGGAGVAPVVLTRVFDAPRDLVYRTFTESEHLSHWWGPVGYQMQVSRLDLRPGGTFLYDMRAENGHEMWGRWVFREVMPPKRIVFVLSFSDEKGNAARHPGVPDWPLEMLSTLTFDQQVSRTLLTVRVVPLSATEMERKTFAAGREGMEQGFSATWDQLDRYLPTIARA